MLTVRIGGLRHVHLVVISFGVERGEALRPGARRGPRHSPRAGRHVNMTHGAPGRLPERPRRRWRAWADRAFEPRDRRQH